MFGLIPPLVPERIFRSPSSWDQWRRPGREVGVLENRDIRLERLDTLRVAHTHVLSPTPEDDAWTKLATWARDRGLLDRVGTRVFGRDTFPTDAPEPHGYEFFLTVGPDVEPEGDVLIGIIPRGLYAVLRFTDLSTIRAAWRRLWDWIAASEYDHVGWRRGDHGWINGYEERLDWREPNPPGRWTFDLWAQLRE